MASVSEGTEPVNYQKWVLKVSIHCEGCKKKIKKILYKVKGVYSIEIDAKQNRVTVTGNVDAESLIQKLLQYGKHAELSPENNPTTVNPFIAAAKKEPKGDEKAASAAPPETEEKIQDDKKKPAESLATTAVSGESTTPNPDADDPSQQKKNNSEKAATADADSKKKAKEVQREEREVTAGMNSPPANQSPANFNPIYTTVRYQTANPSTSYAYYATPPPEIASSYAYYGNQPPPEYPPPPVYSTQPEYSMPAGYSSEYYYSSESYYASMDQQPSAAGSYDMFNDENPNACKLM